MVAVVQFSTPNEENNMFLNLIDHLTDQKRLGAILILSIPAFILITLLLILFEGLLFGIGLDIQAFKTLFYIHAILVGVWISVLLLTLFESPQLSQLEHRHKWLIGSFLLGTMVMAIFMIVGGFFLIVVDSTLSVGTY